MKLYNNRKNSCMIYCKYYNILIIVGGIEKQTSSEYLDLSKINKGWKLFKKKLNPNTIYKFGKLFILNDTKLFLIYTNKLKDDYQSGCEMIDLKEEIEGKNSEKKKEKKDSHWKKVNINIDIPIFWKSRIVNYNFLGKEKIILFEAKNNEYNNLKNKFNFYIIEYNEEKNELIAKEQEININYFIPFFYYSNFMMLDNLRINYE